MPNHTQIRQAEKANLVHSVAGLSEVQRDGGKLLGGAALQEEDLIVVRDGHQHPQVGLSFLNDPRELWAPAREV